MRKTFALDTLVPSAKPPQFPIMSLEERLRWVMGQRGWTMSGWCIAAGLSERTTLDKYFRRIKKRPDASMTIAVLVPLAKAAGVSVDWLATGEGTPVPTPTQEPDARYPTRAQAIQAARVFLYEPEAIERVRLRDDFTRDPGLDYWLALLRAENEFVRKQSSPAGKNEP